MTVRVRIALSTLLAVAVLGGLTGPAAASSARAVPARPSTGSDPAAANTMSRTARPSLVANATVARLAVFDRRDAPSPKRTLTNPTSTGGPLVFLVEKIGEHGWLKVALPVRPNGSTGWVRASDVALSIVSHRIVVNLRDHRLKVFVGDTEVMRESVAIGRRDRPTPGGRYYVTQLFQPPNPDGPYGPYAYALSGFSEVLPKFRGGDAIIGIHGTNRPDLIGQDVSSGCIRMRNDAVTKLAGFLPLGTPVTIKGKVGS